MKPYFLINLCLFISIKSDLILEDFLFNKLSNNSENLSKHQFRIILVNLVDEFLNKINIPDSIIREEELMFRKIIKQFIITFKITEINLKEHNNYILSRFIEFERAFRRDIYIEMMEILGYFKRNLTENHIEHILEHPYHFDLNILNWEILKYRKVGAENLNDHSDFNEEHQIQAGILCFDIERNKNIQAKHEFRKLMEKRKVNKKKEDL